MRAGLPSSALLMTALTTASPAQACRMAARLVPEDVRYADVVVVGQISKYEHVLDQKWREQLKKRDPDAYAKWSSGFITDYVRFTIKVDKVLSGKAPKTLTVTWDASTFGEPTDMMPGPYVIALRRPGSPAGPLRGPSATILPNLEPDSLTVLNPPCAPGFIFPVASPEAAKIGVILTGKAVPGLGALAPSFPARTAIWMSKSSSRKPYAYYPLRAKLEDIEGMASAECIVEKTGRVRRCTTVLESPRSYGFGEATVQLLQNEAQLPPNTFTPGETVRLTQVWRLN